MDYKRNIVLFGLIIMGAGLLSGEAHATDASLTITVSSSNVTANVAPVSDSTGTFIQSNPINVGVSTNNATGYTLAIKANDATHPDRLINSTDNSYLSSISTTTNLATFKATNLSSITTSGGNQGVWGYLPSKANSASNTNFLPSPGTSGNVIEQTSGANSTTNIYTISLGAKVSPLATLGAYTNGFTLTAVANPIPYTISFSENKASGMPDNILDGSSGSTAVTLPSNTPTMDGYSFLGWCDQATTKSGESDTCDSGHQFQPGGTITLNATSNTNNIKLYAMWGPPPYMQDLTSSTIASLLPSVGSTTTVRDKRDQQNYTIAKLADNKYWMVENLNIAGGTALSSTDTDFESSYTLPTTNGWTTNNGKLVLPTSSPSGFSTNNYAYVYNSGNKTSNCSSPGCYSYYSWDAATLGSGRSISTNNTNAPYSICPKGWKLPTTYDGSGTAAEATDFRALMIGYGGSNSIQTYNSSTTPKGVILYYRIGPSTTPNFLLAGSYYSSSFSGGDGAGFYWSATATSSTSTAHHLNLLNSYYIYSANDHVRDFGYSVRCVFSGQ